MNKCVFFERKTMLWKNENNPKNEVKWTEEENSTNRTSNIYIFIERTCNFSINLRVPFSRLNLPLKCLSLHIVISNELDYLLLCFATISANWRADMDVCHGRGCNRERVRERETETETRGLPEGAAARQDTRFASGCGLNGRATEETVIFYTFFPKILAFVASFEKKVDGVLIVALFWCGANGKCGEWRDEFWGLSNAEWLTYPSGCNLTRNRFRLKEIFRIFAHENVLILVMPWNTAIPICATAKFNGTPSISLAVCILMPYNSHRLAVSNKFKSASAGVWPLRTKTKTLFLLKSNRLSCGRFASVRSFHHWMKLTNREGGGTRSLTCVACDFPWFFAASWRLGAEQIGTKTNMCGRGNPRQRSLHTKLNCWNEYRSLITLCQHTEMVLISSKRFVTLYNVAGHQCGSVVIALERSVRQVSFDLQTKQEAASKFNQKRNKYKRNNFMSGAACAWS